MGNGEAKGLAEMAEMLCLSHHVGGSGPGDRRGKQGEVGGEERQWEENPNTATQRVGGESGEAR